MTGYKENLSELVEKESHINVVLGDDSNYTMKVFGSSPLQLESNDLLHLNDVLYVPGGWYEKKPCLHLRFRRQGI